MEADMRPSLKSSVVLLASLSGLTIAHSQAVAQIEFAKSTIRITSASEPTNGTGAVQQAYHSAAVDDSGTPQPGTRSSATRQQQPPSERHATRQADYAPSAAPRNFVHGSAAGRAPSMVNVYSSQSAQTTLSKMPRPAPVRSQSAAQRSQPRGKPFQFVQSDPAVSPYLNLFRKGAQAEDLPNYIMNVRPELERIEANRQQSAELQKLRSQVQNLSGAGGAPNSSMPAHAHYMDTAQFYRTMHR